MQAIILAAGVGSRLKKLTGGKSKALVDIGGRELILHQLEALADHGVGPVMVIVGHDGDELQRVIGDRAETLLNDRFTETNSLYSLWLARHWIQGPFVLLNCDLFFDPGILGRLLEENGNVLAYDSTSSRGQEQTKVAIKQRQVRDLGKDLPVASARGESLGLLKFDEDGARAMLETADHLIRDGHEKAWVIEATRAVCSQVPIFGVNVAGEAWTEIDFPYDLDVARREIWPLIYRGRWGRQVYWKRTRWAAVAICALALSVVGWVANSRVGPASIDWETVPVTSAAAVRVEKTSGATQRWWVAEVDSSIAATVNDPAALLELRLVMPDGTTLEDSLRYVVEVSVDGHPTDWRALTAVRDSTVRLGPAALGDRDQIEVPLPPGQHEVGVKLIAGQGERLLARIRQPEGREE